MRIIVTGVSGFVGQHLARYLRACGHQTVGIGQQTEPSSASAPLLTAYYPCDLTKPKEVTKLPLGSVDAVISLAGLAAVGQSFDKPELYMDVNVKVLSVLCDRLLQIGQRNLRIVAISTGAVYDPSQTMPLDEGSVTNHQSSPYAASKLAMEDAAQAGRQAGLDIVIARPFNHIGPGQEQGFLLPDLYSKIIKAAKTDSLIRVGNLTTRRDYTDVRDIVGAYTSLALAPKLNHSVYNVCSGTSRPGKDLLDLLLNTLGLKDQITIETDQSLIRPNDPKDLYGSYKRLREETGWQPSIDLEQTIKDFVAAQLP